VAAAANLLAPYGHRHLPGRRSMGKLATSAVWVKGIADMLAAEGLDVPALLAAASIDPASLAAPGARVECEKVSRLWGLAVERSGNPAISLAQHQVVRPARFDVVGYTMMSCANLRGAFERMIRYMLILSDALTVILREEQSGYRLTLDVFDGSRPVPRQRVEFILVSLVSYCRWISGREVYPIAAEFPYPSPGNLAPYQQAFQCKVLFDARHSGLLYSREDLTAPLPTSNPALADLHERFAGEYLRRFDRSQITCRVREANVRFLPDGEPRRDQVAGELCISERTLQRRLEVQQTSFVNLLDNTRRELAAQYLGRLNLSFAQAAFLLGFADQSSFFRACKRWFELSPGKYRSQLLRHLLEDTGGN
jgi:AraC-like DNA-binding protein